jgi:hypothetical protein
VTTQRLRKYNYQPADHRDSSHLLRNMAPIPASELPSGATDHGVPGLVCMPATWTTPLLFYVANYLAHCATVKPYPAETTAELLIAIFSALFLPSSGMSRALDSIVRRPRLRKMTELERACISGALCMVVRNTDWEPEIGDVIRDMADKDKGVISRPSAPETSTATSEPMEVITGGGLQAPRNSLEEQKTRLLNPADELFLPTE